MFVHLQIFREKNGRIFGPRIHVRADKALNLAFGKNRLLLDGRMLTQTLSSSPYLLSDSSAILRANISASSIFCSMSRRSSCPRMAVTLMRCISVSASAAFWASSLASSSAIWAFSANRSAVCSERSWRGKDGGGNEKCREQVTGNVKKCKKRQEKSK